MPNKTFSLLYIGNKLTKHGKTPTSVDTLSTQFEELFNVISVSDKLNLFFRMYDIVSSIIKRRKRVDAILIDTYSSLNFYIAIISVFLAKSLGIDYYLYLHGGNLPSRLKKNPRLSAYLFNNSKKNIAPSGYLQDAFSKEGYQTEFIPNNIDISLYPFIHRESVSPKILYVRAFSKVYNPQMAIKAFKCIFDEYPEATMCMVGPDKDGTLEVCKNLCLNLGIDKAVEFTGKLEKKEWISRSKEFDIFVNPTNADNQPVSIIEAMALGLVIVSTNAGGLPYLINDRKDGLLCKVNDDKQMASCIKQLLEDKELASNLSKNAFIKADSYSWKNVKNSWEELFLKNRKSDNYDT